MLKLLEEKLASDPQIATRYVAPLSRILIRNPQSTILRE